MRKLRRLLKEWFFSVVLALALLLSFIILIGNWFVVTSSSMENSLLPGDFIFVNKTSYGARLPYTPFNLPFSTAYSDFVLFGYHRLPGFDTVNRNDVVAFNYPDLDTLVPIDQKPVWIKRVVGLPGETLVVDQAKVHINGKAVEDPGVVKHNYHIKLTGDEAAFFYKYNLREASRMSTQNDWLVSLTPAEAEIIKHYKEVEFVRPEVKKKGVFEEEIYPYELTNGWNEDFYGPVVIPARGLTIRLTMENIPLYRLCIKAYENNDLVEFGNNFYINGKKATTYTFRYNYYFLLGDNRHQSSDSRYWGFLPETHLIGRAASVFFSVDKASRNRWQRLRWNRFFAGIE